MAKVNKSAIQSLELNSSNLNLNKISYRMFFKHSILPRSSIELRTIGHSLTDLEWQKFQQLLIPKLKNSSERKIDGPVLFCGDLGLEAAMILQTKFPNRFHFSMICDTQEHATIALYIALGLNLKISEIHFKNGNNEMVNITDKAFMDKLIQNAEMIALQG